MSGGVLEGVYGGCRQWGRVMGGGGSGRRLGQAARLERGLELLEELHEELVHVHLHRRVDLVRVRVRVRVRIRVRVS